MGNTNYFSGVIKILEDPKECLIQKTVPLVTCHAEISQVRKNRIISLSFWGNLAREIKKYYGRNDYILIEGYLSTRIQSNSNKKKAKQILITVLRVYPIFLNSDRIN